jgi:outer membrane protein
MDHARRRKATFAVLLVAWVPMTLRPPALPAQAPPDRLPQADVPTTIRPPALPAQAPPGQAAQATPPQAAAPAVRRLTLEEARQLALGSNKALALARLNVEEKGHAADAASKDYYPKLIGSETYFHFDKDLGSVVTIRRGQRGILAPGVTTVAANVVNQNASLSTIFVAQPITKLIAVNAATQIARADENAARAQLDKGTRDLLSGVAQAYHSLLGLRRIETALGLQIQVLEQAVAAKPAPEVRVALLETRQGLSQVRGQARDLNDQLANLLDLPPCTVLELVDPVPADLSVRCADDAAQLALAHSPEVREAEENIAKAEAALKVARMAYLPDISVVGGFANQTSASYIQPDVGYVGVAGSWTLFEWGKKRDVTRQRPTDIALAQQNVRVTIDKVTLEARKAFVGFEQAREAYQLAGEMVQARKDAEKAAEGAALLQAKGETAKAELEYMKAEIAYRVAHAQLAALVCQE